MKIAGRSNNILSHVERKVAIKKVSSRWEQKELLLYGNIITDEKRYKT